MKRWDNCKPLFPPRPLINHVYDHKKDKKKENVRSSAFRAVKAVDQTIAANTFVKVLYQNEQFDLANEYNPATSTFIPAMDGVYNIFGTYTFEPNNPNLDYRIRVEIRINGNPAVANDNDFFGGGLNFTNVVNVSTILQLQAGDRVEVFAVSSIAGTIKLHQNGGNSTHFEAARFPSPANC